MTHRIDTTDDPRELTGDEVQRRVAWARSRGHPRYLWPDVPRESWQESSRAVARAVAAVLSGEEGVALESPRGARALGVAAYTTGTGPLLGAWLQQGRLRANEATAAILTLHLEHGRARAGRRAELVAHALSVLPASAPRVLLKGAHTGRAYFPEPGTRPGADADVLVDSGAFADGEAALAAAGYRRVGRQGPGRSTWLPPGQDGRIRALDFAHADNPLMLDLHGTLARGFYGVATVDPGPLGPDDTVRLEGGRDDPRVLAPPLLLLFLAAHASEDFHNLQLVRLVELVLVSRALTASCPGAWLEALERGRSMGALRFVYPALHLAHKLVPEAVDEVLLAAARADAPRRMRRVLRRLEPGLAQGFHRLGLAGRFMWARGPVEVTRRALHMLAPSSAGGSPRALLALYQERALRLLRGRVGLGGGG